jgi:Uma2 family endonuclease
MRAHPTDTIERSVTLEEFERMPEEDAFRVELVRGRVVREPLPGARHASLNARLLSRIDAHVRTHDLGITLAEAGFILSVDPPTVRGPDIAFLGKERIPEEGVPVGFWPGAPDLAVEIVSPSNRAGEIREKVLEYLGAGTRLVWVVDPATRSVAAYRSREEIRLLTAGDDLDGVDVLPGFRLALSVLFAQA